MLLRPISFQARETVHRQHGGQESSHAESEEYPDEGKGVGPAERVGDTLCPPEMDDRHQQCEESAQEHDDQPCAPAGKDQCAPEQDGKDERRDEDHLDAELTRVVDEVARQVNCQEEDREKR